MRARTAGTDVQVTRQGDDLLLNIPSGINFAHDSATVQPQFQRTLDQVAQVLGQYDRTYVDVYGHTDLTGRPQLQSGPVGAPRPRRRQLFCSWRPARPARHPRLRRETQPIASNETEDGRAPTGGSKSRSSRSRRTRWDRRWPPGRAALPSPCATAAPGRNRAAAPSPPRPCRQTPPGGDEVGCAKKRAPCSTVSRLSDPPRHNRAAHLGMRDRPAHIAHGSSVTHRSQSASRSRPSACAAALIASTSAWAVGSYSRRGVLAATAITSPLRATTAPTGTSPALPPSRAASSAARIGAGSGNIAPLSRPPRRAVEFGLLLRRGIARLLHPIFGTAIVLFSVPTSIRATSAWNSGACPLPARQRRGLRLVDVDEAGRHARESRARRYRRGQAGHA